MPLIPELAGSAVTSGSLSASWRQLADEHRRWLLYNAFLGTALVNLVLNGAFAWLGTWGHAEVPLWASAVGHPSILTDTIGTLFMLPFMTCVMCSAAVHRSQRRGELPALAPALRLPAWLRRLPGMTVRRGLTMGAVTVAVMAPLAALALVTVDAAGMSRLGFTVYKAVFGVILGSLVTPVIAVRAMSDPAVPAAG